MTLSEVHNRFFSFRNGIVAKAFHDAGSPYRRIFGLQLPSLAAIAREAGSDSSLAFLLLEEKDCRESRLLAFYLLDPLQISEEEAVALAENVLTREEADILAWRLLRRLPFASSLPSRLTGYIKEALLRNLEGGS